MIVLVIDTCYFELGAILGGSKHYVSRAIGSDRSTSKFESISEFYDSMIFNEIIKL